MIRIIFFLLAGVSLYFLPDFCRRQTDGFSIARITSVLPPEYHFPNSEISHPEALDQSYSYLGCGGQCFAFVSQDGQYVIKFFKTRFYSPYRYILTHPLFFPFESARQRKLKKAEFKLQRDFNSYKIAYETLKEETGLLYLHLEKTSSLNKKLSVRDKLGIAHEIDLDRYEFAVQKRATLALEHFDTLLKHRDFDQIKTSLRSLIEVTLLRCKKGVYDEDAKIHRNFGFLHNQAIFIDIGRFVQDASRMQEEIYQKDLMAIIDQLEKWIATHYPTLTPYVDEIVQDILKT